MKIWIMLVQKSIRSFYAGVKNESKTKDFSFLVEQSPVKQSAFCKVMLKNDYHMDWAFHFSYPNEWT